MYKVAVTLACMVGCGKVIELEIDASMGMNTCGDGAVGGSEACDVGALNGQASSCCSATCTFLAASEVCRPSTGECDTAEMCTGSTASCPADVTAIDGSSCSGNGASACSLGDTCSGGVCLNNDRTTGTSCAIDACHNETCSNIGACVSAVQAVAIIESLSQGTTYTMETRWKTAAEAMGYTATIYPQTQLDNIANLAGADILIVSSGTITLTQTRRDVVAAFVASKRGAYVQGEYLASYEGNITFEQVADANGAVFSWGAAIVGQFPAAPAGCVATTPTAISTTFQQNYAVTGAATGAGLHTVQVNQTTAQAVSFEHCRAGGGLIIVKTDQDDINAGAVPELLTNILYRLSAAETCVQ